MGFVKLYNKIGIYRKEIFKTESRKSMLSSNLSRTRLNEINIHRKSMLFVYKYDLFIFLILIVMWESLHENTPLMILTS